MVRLFSMRDYECYVVPTAEAERVARETAADWLNTLKRDGSQREANFPYCIRFELNKNRPDVSNYQEKWKAYRDAWYLLEQAG
jgi:hypothetical protein